MNRFSMVCRVLAFGLVLSSAAAFADGPTKRDGFDWKPVQLLAIQERGRLKPLETFAIESVRFVTGKSAWKGMNATEVLFGWLIAYDKEWKAEPFIRLDYQPLKRALGLPIEPNYFSPQQLEEAPAFAKILRDVTTKERKKDKLDELEKKAVELRNRMGTVSAAASGELLTLLPNPENENAAWFSLASAVEPGRVLYAPEKNQKLSAALTPVLKSFESRDAASWNGALGIFVPLLRDELAPGLTGNPSRLKAEVKLNSMHPFRWAWMLYLVSFLAFLVFFVTGKPRASTVGLVATASGFVMHTGGFLLRCYIAGRPPVTNMYESVIWVSWGTVLFAGIIFLAYRKHAIIAASTVFAIVALVLADNLPNVLDPGIHPLEPVLRSNFWLTIHVLTITLSYAAFALALCLGNVVLGSYFRSNDVKARSQELTLYMYRAVQIGVVLLAAGTILGGIWADYSWGRFWGWDPKEVWALIALLLYLAVLHGRFTGWLAGFGFATATIVSFLGVLMAWYGVNFVLGVGLHSYGFGTGGLEYVGSYVLAQLAFIGVAYGKYSKLKASGAVDARIFPKGH